ncbi:MAG TPA: nuclear transport factor 2 family protein [Candidatus Binatia bacterium]|nr:nuclear transport factor 2 family protein [Candidatus Binatia bacterium]
MWTFPGIGSRAKNDLEAPAPTRVAQEAIMASDLARFFHYAQAFELAWLGDGWGHLADHFTADALHVVHGGGAFGDGASGRAAVVDGLRDSTRRVDRRFDVRIPEILEGPIVRPDGVWMRYALTLRRAGLPDFRFEGRHLAAYERGRIRSLEDWPEPGTAGRLAAYLATHASRLHPEGGVAPPALSPNDVRDLDAAVARSLARSYGAAKSQQDIDAALAVCSEDFVLETMPLGLAARGRGEARRQLETFFGAFPDYRVTVEGIAAEGASVACWGRALMTFDGPFLGFAPTGRAADLPFVSVFACEGGALRGERFYFDLATLCDRIGVPVAEMAGVAATLAADTSGSEPARSAAEPAPRNEATAAAALG